MDFTQGNFPLFKAGLIPALIFIAILATIKVGWYYGSYLHKKSKGARNATDETLVSAILGLMALVVAFTFNGAAGRLDQREHLILAEVNSISSAITAVSYVNPDDQNGLRATLRDYLDKRMVLYTDIFDKKGLAERQQLVDAIFSTLNAQALTAVQNVSPDKRALANDLVRKVNDLTSAYDNQRQAMWMHPPKIIWISLIALVIIGSFLAGYKSGLSQRKERFLTLLFALLMSFAMYLILSLEFPLLGHVNLDAFNNEFVRLRDSLPVTQHAINMR